MFHWIMITVGTLYLSLLLIEGLIKWAPLKKEPIFRLLQDSRRVPPSADGIKRDPSSSLSFGHMLNKVWTACMSRRRNKRNLYQELENTVYELEADTQMTGVEVSALKNSVKKNQDSMSKNEQRKWIIK